MCQHATYYVNIQVVEVYLGCINMQVFVGIQKEVIEEVATCKLCLFPEHRISDFLNAW